MAAAFSESLALHPAVVAVVGDELDFEFQVRVERGPNFFPMVRRALQ